MSRKQYRKVKDITEIVRLAVHTLIESNKKVTVAEVSELTGIDKQILYRNDDMKKHIRKKARGEKEVKFTRPSIEQDEVEQTVEAYIDYIKDNYFNHASEVQSVKFDFLASVKEFNPQVFSQAINKLTLDKILKPTLHPLQFIIEPERVEKKLLIIDYPKNDNAQDFPVIDEEETEQCLGESVFFESEEARTWDYRFSLGAGKGIAFSHESNLNADDLQDAIDYLDLIRRRFQRRLEQVK